MRMRKTLIILLFISGLLARQSIVYFYVIPFDNIKDDPTIDWIASGLSDMVSDRFKSEPELLIQNKKDLVEIDKSTLSNLKIIAVNDAISILEHTLAKPINPISESESQSVKDVKSSISGENLSESTAH